MMKYDSVEPETTPMPVHRSKSQIVVRTVVVVVVVVVVGAAASGGVVVQVEADAGLETDTRRSP
jgi:1,4-dihydroxy-2-naphthoyl-CoA synthase